MSCLVSDGSIPCKPAGGEACRETVCDRMGYKGKSAYGFPDYRCDGESMLYHHCPNILRDDVRMYQRSAGEIGCSRSIANQDARRARAWFMYGRVFYGTQGVIRSN